MFEKLTRKLVKGAKRAVKEEAVQSALDVVPVLVGVASLIGVIFGSIPPKQAAASTITINNYYYGRR